MTTPLECDFTEYMIKSIPLDDGLTFPENDDLYKKTLGFLYQQNPDATFSETTSLSDSKYFISGCILRAKKEVGNTTTYEEVYVSVCYKNPDFFSDPDLYFVIYDIEGQKVIGFNAFKVDQNKIPGSRVSIGETAEHVMIINIIFGNDSSNAIFGVKVEREGTVFILPPRSCFMEGSHADVLDKIFSGKPTVQKIESKMYSSS